MFTFFRNPNPHTGDQAKAMQARQHEATETFNQVFGHATPTPMPAPVATPAPMSQPPMQDDSSCPRYQAEKNAHHNEANQQPELCPEGRQINRRHMKENCEYGRVRAHQNMMDGPFVLDAGGDKIGPVNAPVRQPAPPQPVIPPDHHMGPHALPAHMAHITPSPVDARVDFTRPFEFSDLMR